MPEEELTRLYEVMRSFDSARQPEDQMHPLSSEPPRLIPRRILFCSCSQTCRLNRLRSTSTVLIGGTLVSLYRPKAYHSLPTAKAHIEPFWAMIQADDYDDETIQSVLGLAEHLSKAGHVRTRGHGPVLGMCMPIAHIVQTTLEQALYFPSLRPAIREKESSSPAVRAPRPGRAFYLCRRTSKGCKQLSTGLLATASLPIAVEAGENIVC